MPGTRPLDLIRMAYWINFDNLVKSCRKPEFVIPVKAGIQRF